MAAAGAALVEDFGVHACAKSTAAGSHRSLIVGTSPPRVRALKAQFQSVWAPWSVVQPGATLCRFVPAGGGVQPAATPIDSSTT